MLGKIGQRAMIRDHFATAIRLHLRIPLLFCRSEPLVEFLEPLLEMGGISGISLAYLAGQAARNPAPVVGVPPMMRIAQGVGTAQRARARPQWELPALWQLGR